jgi:type IV pilus assembly protein PilM
MAKGVGVGLDIGNGFLKIVQLRNTSRGTQLDNFAIREVPKKFLPQGIEVDRGKIVETIREVFRKSKIKTNLVVSAISGKLVSKKFIELPFMNEEELKRAIVWEAEKYIPYKVEDVILDTQILAEKTDKEGKKIEVLLVAAKKEVIHNHLNMLREAGLKTEIIDGVSFALINSFESKIKEKEETVALIDMGAEITHLCILKKGVLKFNRGIRLAGNKLTFALKEKMGGEFNQAEEKKKEAGEEAFQTLTPLLEQLTREIGRSFDYYETTSQGGKIERVILTGGTSKLPGIDKFFSKKMNIPVEIGNPLENLRAGRISGLAGENAPLLSVAIGLALRGLE